MAEINEFSAFDEMLSDEADRTSAGRLFQSTIPHHRAKSPVSQLLGNVCLPSNYWERNYDNDKIMSFYVIV